MLTIYIEAPFAAFRTFTAGWYRPTATFLTPSAAYGLLMNVAGIDTRLREENPLHSGKTPATLTRDGLPTVELALGVPEFQRRRGRTVPIDPADLFPRVQSIFQQLHNYPVGASGKSRAAECKGNKYNITPVRREFLSNLRAVIAIRADDGTKNRICSSLGAEPPAAADGPRYGVPFLGDNAFLLDRMEVLTEPGLVRWFEKIAAASDSGPLERTTRLTQVIDRADLSRTTSALYAPQTEPRPEPPPLAWTEIASPHT